MSEPQQQRVVVKKVRRRRKEGGQAWAPLLLILLLVPMLLLRSDVEGEPRRDGVVERNPYHEPSFPPWRSAKPDAGLPALDRDDEPETAIPTPGKKLRDNPVFAWASPLRLIPLVPAPPIGDAYLLEDPGKPVPVPEPGILSLLAAGGTPLLIRRRRANSRLRA